MSRYIDAEKLERFVKRDEWDTPDERWRPESEFGRFVDAVPTEDVAPVVHAHWEWNDDERGWIDWKDPACDDISGWRCSHCKNMLDDMVGGLYGFEDEEDPPELKYCPECGARMDTV